MKKNILKSLIVLSFAFVAILSAAYLQDLKQKLKEEEKVIKKKEMSQIYTYKNSQIYGFNLPLIVIDTEGKSISSDQKVEAQIQVYDNSDELNYLIDEPALSSKATIKTRGNTSKYYPKKPYGIELTNNKGKEKKEKLLGLSEDSEWVLNGPFADKSLMRNYIAYKTSRNIMEYAPNVKFCEVFVIDDGSKTLNQIHYKGVYILVEKIKRSDDKVDIVKSQDNINETSFIAAKDRQKDGDVYVHSYGKEISIYERGINIEYPKKDLTPKKHEYIKKYISEFERVLYSDKFNDPVEGYSKYIDVDSFVDYYIINEFFKNNDAGIYSTYMYKDYNEKMKAGPVWDFNRSMGNYRDEEIKDYDYTGFFMNTRSWFDRLVEDVNFSNKLIDRYNKLRSSYLSDEYLLNLIEETKQYLGDSIQRNFEQWPIYMANQAYMFERYGDLFKEYEHDSKVLDKFLKDNNRLFDDTEGKAQSYDEEIELMKNFIVQRGKWMDENIDSLSKWAK